MSKINGITIRLLRLWYDAQSREDFTQNKLQHIYSSYFGPHFTQIHIVLIDVIYVLSIGNTTAV